jgi:tetratricopeptide (TPR) repeat protein
MRLFLVLLVVSVNLLSGCSGREVDASSRLGAVHLNVTGKPEAQPHFEKGLLLLHSFQYSDAQEAFAAARSIDPNMAMAYWGEAMTHNHPIWQEQDYTAATAIIDSLDKVTAELTEIERDFIAAMRLLYTPNLEKAKRDANYAEALKAMTVKYPSSEEVAAFYALSIMGAVQEGRDTAAYALAAKVAMAVIEKNPEHPGALHYYIHACDDPENSAKAIDQAYAYAKVAPDAAHALHMPSHIFLAMGLWDDLVASNVDAWNASDERRIRKELDYAALDYHSFHWLMYGYLQRGQVDSAEAVVRRMAAYAEKEPVKRARVHISFQQSTFLAETGDYTHSVFDIPVDITGFNITSRAQHHYVKGVNGFQRNDTTGIANAYRIIEKDCRLEALFLDTADFKICIDLDRDMPRQIDIDLSTVMALQLRGFDAQLRGDTILAESRFREAAELDHSLSYSFGPPVIRKPATELYADWLLDRGRYEEAREQYTKTLERNPGRRLSLEGLKRIDQNLSKTL